MTRWVKKISRFLFIVMFVNFTLLWCIGLSLGGSALNGKIDRGHYYLGNHGDLTEVTESTWNYCYYHEVSVLITHPLGIGSMVLADRLEKKSKSAEMSHS